jgi:hypothetical protein
LELSQQGIPVYSINYKDKPEAARRFLATHGNPFRAIGTDASGFTAIDFGVYGVPETFVIDGDGKIAFRYPGPLSADVVADKIMPAIKKAERAGEPGVLKALWRRKLNRCRVRMISRRANNSAVGACGITVLACAAMLRSTLIGASTSTRDFGKSWVPPRNRSQSLAALRFEPRRFFQRSHRGLSWRARAFRRSFGRVSSAPSSPLQESFQGVFVLMVCLKRSHGFGLVLLFGDIDVDGSSRPSQLHGPQMAHPRSKSSLRL